MENINNVDVQSQSNEEGKMLESLLGEMAKHMGLKTTMKMFSRESFTNLLKTAAQTKKANQAPLAIMGASTYGYCVEYKDKRPSDVAALLSEFIDHNDKTSVSSFINFVMYKWKQDIMLTTDERKNIIALVNDKFSDEASVHFLDYQDRKIDKDTVYIIVVINPQMAANEGLDMNRLIKLVEQGQKSNDFSELDALIPSALGEMSINSIAALVEPGVADLLAAATAIKEGVYTVIKQDAPEGQSKSILKLVKKILVPCTSKKRMTDAIESLREQIFGQRLKASLTNCIKLVSSPEELNKEAAKDAKAPADSAKKEAPKAPASPSNRKKT